MSYFVPDDALAHVRPISLVPIISMYPTVSLLVNIVHCIYQIDQTKSCKQVSLAFGR